MIELEETKRMNHAIVTRYTDGTKNIGRHSDKAKDLDPCGYIIVLKTGPSARTFNIYNQDSSLVWGNKLAPGTAVIMNMQANGRYLHEVPQDDGAGDR